MIPHRPAALAALLASFAAGPVAAQGPQPAPSAPVPLAVRRAALDTLAERLVARYVFPEVAARMAADLRARAARGEYDALEDGEAFSAAVTRDLRAVSHDRHLGLFYFPGGAPPDEVTAPAAAATPRQREEQRLAGYGLDRVQRLPGNVGLLALHGFFPDTPEARRAMAHVMGILANTDALIVDLRENGGGEPEMVAYLTSFLFPKGRRVHLNDLHWREGTGERIVEHWTEPGLDAPRITGDVYVLTSATTFSAGEEFTNNLKVLKRATIVGETTGGGANPGYGVRLAGPFGAFVPTGRAVNPVTGTNWEGTGVAPDIAVPAAQALTVAHLRALEALRAKAADPRLRARYDAVIERVKGGAAQ